MNPAVTLQGSLSSVSLSTFCDALLPFADHGAPLTRHQKFLVSLLLLRFSMLMGSKRKWF